MGQANYRQFPKYVRMNLKQSHFLECDVGPTMYNSQTHHRESPQTNTDRESYQSHGSGLTLWNTPRLESPGSCCWLYMTQDDSSRHINHRLLQTHQQCNEGRTLTEFP